MKMPTIGQMEKIYKFNSNLIHLILNVSFQVKQCECVLAHSNDEETMYSPKGRSFMVKRIQPKEKYSKAHGKYLVDGKPNNDYKERYYPKIKDDEIPCAGCREWVPLNVPGVKMEEIFSKRSPNFLIAFGKYKSKSIEEIYAIEPQYIYWLIEQDHYFRVDFHALLNIPLDSPDAKSIILRY